mmetsp:Transcript_71657/g.131209  ORF Transcript_71657/g.131209 Transcript_71657/m.131209 type:complete len:397 (-) Transcript_71657:39-1229(-)
MWRRALSSFLSDFLLKAVLGIIACLANLPASEAIAKKGWSTMRGDSDGNVQIRPKIFFLFLANDGLPNEEIWLRFLAPAKHGVDYEAFLHCQNEVACRKNVSSQELFHIVPTVPSKWCEDLVSPMDALLQAALSTSSASTDVDSFTFVSDTTVPVKPFQTIWQRMTLDRANGSSFCISPRHWWGVSDLNRSIVVKHQQWLTLSRAHANRVVANRDKMRNLVQVTSPEDFILGDYLTPYYQKTLGKFLPRARLNGCLDEYLYFALVYGFVDNQSAVALPGSSAAGFTGNPLNITEAGAQEYQGQCDTLSFFGYGSDFKQVAGELEADGLTQLELSWSEKHPASFQTLSNTSLKVLRRSKFLFARKIDSRATRFTGRAAQFLSLPDAFEQLVFQTGEE